MCFLLQCTALGISIRLVLSLVRDSSVVVIIHSDFWNFVVFGDEKADEDVNGKDYYFWIQTSKVWIYGWISIAKEQLYLHNYKNILLNIACTYSILWFVFVSFSFSLFMLISNERRFLNSGTDFNSQSFMLIFYYVNMKF